MERIKLTPDEIKDLMTGLQYGDKKELAYLLGVSPSRLHYIITPTCYFDIGRGQWMPKLSMDRLVYDKVFGFIFNLRKTYK